MTKVEGTKLEIAKSKILQVMLKLWVLSQLQTTITFSTGWARWPIRYQMKSLGILFSTPPSLLHC